MSFSRHPYKIGPEAPARTVPAAGRGRTRVTPPAGTVQAVTGLPNSRLDGRSARRVMFSLR